MFDDEELQKFGRFVTLADALANPGRYVLTESDLVGLTIRVSPDIKARLEEYAEASGNSMQYIARRLIELGLSQLDEVCIGLQAHREEVKQREYEYESSMEGQERIRAEFKAKALNAVKAMKGGQ